MAREQPGVLEHESIQRAAAREQPGVLEHESIQRANARLDPAKRMSNDTPGGSNQGCSITSLYNALSPRVLVVVTYSSSHFYQLVVVTY